MTRRSGYVLAALPAAVALLVAAAWLLGIGAPAGVTAAADARPSAGAAAAAAAGDWVGTWAAAPVAGEPDAPHGFPGMTLRNVVHTSIAGTAARVRLSNLYGTAPLTLAHATIALAAGPGGSAAAAAAPTGLTFAGRASVTVPPGGSVLSDPARLAVPAGADLLVSIYTPKAGGPATYHPTTRQTSFAAVGDRTADAAGTAFTTTTPYWRYVTAVEVQTEAAQGAVVAFGDSITDGLTSTADADHRWPDYLAARLRTERGAPRLGVLDEGISGNRILLGGAPDAPADGESGLGRLSRDALSAAGVRTVIVELGINDLIEPPHQTDPDAVIAGLQEITREAHSRGIRVLGTTLTPFRGQHSWTPQLEQVRQQVNAAIRSGRVFDAVVDFDRALRDPRQPDRLLPAYDSGDHLHPDDAGYAALARSFDLGSLLGGAPARI